MPNLKRYCRSRLLMKRGYVCIVTCNLTANKSIKILLRDGYGTSCFPSLICTAFHVGVPTNLQLQQHLYRGACPTNIWLCMWGELGILVHSGPTSSPCVQT
jgi:hypothetical protein